MTKTTLPPRDVLLQLLRYEPETGRLFWRPREGGSTRWNTRWAGKEAFTAPSRGYRTGRVFDQQFFAHRVIWKMTWGEEPDEIDHIDGDRSNNRLANLRSVTCQVNGQNKALLKRNTSGFVGVHWEARRKSWRVVIQVSGRQKHVGSFQSLDEAVAARRAAQAAYGYHENHGAR